MSRPRRRLLAAIVSVALAPIASGCTTDSGDGTAAPVTTTATTTPTPTDGESTTTDAPPTTEPCTTPEYDVLEDLAVRDDRTNQTPVTVTITRSDDTVVYEATFGGDDSTRWSGRIFDESTYYTVAASVDGGGSASETVEVTGADWMRRYGVTVQVAEDGSVSIYEYHADPVCA
jgi:hypothetical protein